MNDRSSLASTAVQGSVLIAGVGASNGLGAAIARRFEPPQEIQVMTPEELLFRSRQHLEGPKCLQAHTFRHGRGLQVARLRKAPARRHPKHSFPPAVHHQRVLR